MHEWILWKLLHASVGKVHNPAACTDIMFIASNCSEPWQFLKTCASALWILNLIWNTAQRVRQHLFPNCRPSLSCFWLSKGNPSIPLPQPALFLLSFSSSFFHDGATEPFPTENYSESLSTAPSQSVPLLCSLLRVPFPSSSPLGPARKESSVMALWRENGGIHPMLCWW